MSLFIFNLVCMEQKRILAIDKQRFNHINIFSKKSRQLGTFYLLNNPIWLHPQKKTLF